MKPLNEYGIDHVGFIVPDLEEAVRHVEEQYGVKSVVRMSPYLQHAWTRGVDHPSSASAPWSPWPTTPASWNFWSR